MTSSFGLHLVILLLAAAAVHMSAAAAASKRMKRSAERRLYDVLFRSYDPGCRPVVIATTAVNVSVSVSLHQIMDLVEKNQTLITQLWIEEEWIDETLQWLPNEFDNLSSLVVPSINVWLPDIYIFNNADRGDDGFVSLNDSRVTVRHDGCVRWVVPLIVHSACAVDVTYFPFDEQQCFVRFGSWIYDEHQVNLSLRETAVRLDSYSVNTELDLLQTVIVREPATEPASRLPLAASAVSGHGRGPHLKVTINIRRKPLYYGYTIVAPTLVLCALNLFSFLLPCDNGNKVGIGLTVFLSLYVLQLAIAKNIPESNTLPLIGVFLTLVMTLNAVSLVCATLVINVKKQADMCYCPAVPRLVLAFCRVVLGRLTCTAYGDVDYGGGSRHPVASCVDAAAAEPSVDGRSSRSAALPTSTQTNVATRLTVPERHAAGMSSTDGIGLSPIGGGNCVTERGRSSVSLSPAARSIVNTPNYQAATDAYEHFRLHPAQAPDVVVSSSSDRRCSDGNAEDTDDFRSHRLQRRRCRRPNGVESQPNDNGDGDFEMKTYAGATSKDDETGDVIRKTSLMSIVYDSKDKDASRRSSVTAEAVQEARREWCYVAETLDKTMFILFLTAMLTIILVSLVIVPYCKRSAFN